MGSRQPARAAIFGSCLIALAAFLAPAAALAHGHHASHRTAHRAGGHLPHRFAASSYGAGHVIQCVAFARADTGIEISGNAANWWDNAAGVYARGNAPEIGSVLNFRANARMRLGHVAVVSEVVNSRSVIIDQSHWNSRGVTRDISVIDVSPDNDWTAVRVGLGRGENFGSIYPTYGFIYARPDHSGVVLARATSDMPMIDANPVPSRLRAYGGRRHAVVMEVAEAPAMARGIDLSTAHITDDAPDRSFR